MSATNASASDIGRVEPTSRSSDLVESLTMERAARRAVVLTGNTSDVLVAPGRGNLVRLPELLAIWAGQQGCDFLHLDSRHGGRQILPPGSTPAGSPLSFPPASMLELLNTATHTLPHHPRPVVVSLDWSCLELGADNGDLLRTLLEVPADPALSSNGHQLIVVFKTDPPPRQLTVMPGFAVIPIGLPDAGERRYVMAESHKHAAIPLEPGLTVDGVATTLGGIDADGLLRTAHEARSSRPLSPARIVAIKSAEIERVAGGTVMVSRDQPPNGIAGMAGLRLYVESRLRANRPIGTILLGGVTGVGKTYSALWLAQRLGLPLVSVGQIKAGIVGESEVRWARARQTLVANAPSLVFIDEVDQAGLGKRGHNLDAGVSDHLRAELLKFTNDALKLGIAVVLATNNPAGIDPAGLDRVYVIPCLHPTSNEAVEIMILAAEREGLQLDADAARDVLAGQGVLMTGRQLVRLLDAAAVYAAGAGHPNQIDRDDLVAAASDGLEVGNQANQEYMALSAILLCESVAALPWVAAERLGEPVEVPPYIRPLLDRSGVLDMQAVHARLHQLRSAGHGFNN
jgi:hypothetical protein